MSQIAVANSAKFTVKQLPTPCIKLAAADLVPLNRARHKLDVLGSLDPRVRKLLGSSSKKAGPPVRRVKIGSVIVRERKVHEVWRAQSAYRGKPGLHRCE